ncbi:MAG: hypothetical protein QF535_18755, partial [Anaerolineales bacterium]|nr:hypothetical protein [Anaerolineales bacterium]
YLTPTNTAANNKLLDYRGGGCEESPTAGLNAINWQAWFGTSWADPNWLLPRPNAPQGGHTRSIPQLVVWDEIFTVDPEVIDMLVPWLLKKGATIVFIGDEEQLENFNGHPNYDTIMKYVEYEHPFLDVDRRSKDDETRELKMKLRGLSEEAAAKEITDCIGFTEWDKFLEEWTPNSLVYATTHAMTDYLVPILTEIHKNKFAGRPIPWMFQQDTVYNDEKYHNCEIIELPYETNFEPPPNCRLAYTMTVQKSIGDTVKDKVFLIADRNSSVFSNRGIYTAATRIERLNQLFWVKPTKDAMRSAHTITDDLETQIEKRIRFHKEADKKANRPTEDGYINVEYIKDLIENTHDDCRYCNEPMEYFYYFDRSPDRWSINRLDNNLAHVEGNVEICCRSCNIHKRS